MVLVSRFSVEHCKYKSKFAIKSNQGAYALLLFLRFLKGNKFYGNGVDDNARSEEASCH